MRPAISETPRRRHRTPPSGAAPAVLPAAALVASLLAALLPAPAPARGTAPGDPAGAPEIIVYAAASLRDVLEATAPACAAATGTRLLFNFGGSNDLARQILAADKADVFFSADEAWMDAVAAAGLVDAASRRPVLSNRLVVIGPADSGLVILAPGDLAAPRLRRLSLADPEVVPAGRYARAWLETAGVWSALRDRVVPALDVRAALAAVESGAADAGIVYRTDARIGRHVRVLYEVPSDQGPSITYVVAAMAARPHLGAARRVAAWLAGPEAATAFARAGFIPRSGAP